MLLGLRRTCARVWKPSASHPQVRQHILSLNHWAVRISIRISISVSVVRAVEESGIFSTLGFTFVWGGGGGEKQVSSKSLLCFLVELQNREITLLFFHQSKSLSLFKKKTFLFHKVRKKKKTSLFSTSVYVSVRIFCDKRVSMASKQ